MKARFLLFGLLMTGSISAIAQIGNMRNNWAIGINGGMNLNTVSFEPRIKQKMQKGITGGITVRYICEKYFSMICGVQAEINFSQRGWEENIEDRNNTYSRTMNYIEVPFLAHLAFGKEPRGVQFFISLGPQFGYLLGEKESYGGSDPWNPSNRRNEQYGITAQKKFDYGIVGGGGLELRTKAGNFLLEGRYYFGLADFYNSTKKDPFSRSAHTTISVRLAYLFDLTKY